MAKFPNIVLTNLGLNMIAQSHTGSPLIFTKMKLGNGNLEEAENIKELSDVKNIKVEVPLHSITPVATGQVKIRFSLADIDIAEGFFVREVGVFAKVGEDGIEQLYAYTNAGNLTDYLDASDLPINELIDLDLVVGNATVLNVLVKDEISATMKDLEEHNSNPNAHSDLGRGGGFAIGQTTIHLGSTPPPGFLELDGVELNRATYPNLWEWVQTQIGLLVDEAKWLTEKNENGECGFYSSGDGLLTFRLPLINSFARAKGNSERKVGEWKKDSSNCLAEVDARVLNPAQSPANASIEVPSNGKWSDWTETGDAANSSGVEKRFRVSGNETYPKNITFLYCVKAFDAESNQGLIDLTELANEVSALKHVGEVAYFATKTPPKGWLKANGAEISRTDYASLFSTIGTTFGEGDGATTFVLPDLRGEFIRGWDDGREVDYELNNGVISNREFGSWQKGSVINFDGPNSGAWTTSLYHGINNNDGTGASIFGLDIFDSNTHKNANYCSLRSDSSSHLLKANAGISRPRNIALLACIKY